MMIPRVLTHFVLRHYLETIYAYLYIPCTSESFGIVFILIKSAYLSVTKVQLTYLIKQSI